jgi:hypothetical protein
MKKIISAAFLTLSICMVSAQGNLSKSEFMALNFTNLAKSKAQIKNSDQNLMPAYKNLIGNCNANLKFPLVSVMDKTDVPPSGDKHDYMSLAPYWWPDPNTKGGLPYIRRDGDINPEVNNYPDKDNMPKLCQKVYELSLGFYFSDNEKYAKKASDLIRVWFLNPATKMNPNLNFGQAIKGIDDGRGAGLIDTRQFIYLLEGVKLLNKSTSWTSKDNASLKDWFRSYYAWLNNSKNGKDEKNAGNNHGIWYDAQSLAITNYLDSLSESRIIIKRALGRLEKQMNAEGAFPAELARTNSLHYSSFVLNAFENVAQLSENIGVDFRNAKLSNGMSLKNAYDFLMPYLIEKKKWSWPNLKPFEMSNGYTLLTNASKYYNCTECISYINTHVSQSNQLILQLL